MGFVIIACVSDQVIVGKARRSPQIFAVIQRAWKHAITGICLAMATSVATDSAHGQILLSPAFEREQPPKEPATSPPGTRVIRLHAAGEPDPALQYRFWPAPNQRRNVSPHPFLSRAMLLSNRALAEDREQSFTETYNRLSALSLDELPTEEVHQFLAQYATDALEQVLEIDVLMDTTYDLQMEGRSLAEIVSLSLPEIQEYRQLARLLALRARLAVAESRWDDAVTDLRVGFRLSQIASESVQNLIGKLVGIAVAGMMLGVVEEAIQQPDCPNLYWALATVPSEQLYTMREALEYEIGNVARLIIDSGVHGDMPIGPDVARDQLVSIVRQVLGLDQQLNERSADAISRLDATSRLIAGLYVIAMAEPSRELIAQSAAWSPRAAGRSVPELVLLATRLRLLRSHDDWMKWTLLLGELNINIEEKLGLGPIDLRSTDIVTVVFGLLMPAVNAARAASRRSAQQHHLWMTAEALRMHAAETGELPPSLEALRPVPALPDSVAQAPFQYQRTSPTTASLTHAPRWSGDTDNTVQFELIITTPIE